MRISVAGFRQSCRISHGSQACAARPRRPTSLRARAPRFRGTPCGRTAAPSARARRVPISRRRSPPLPITIDFWPSRSTQTTAPMRSRSPPVVVSSAKRLDLDRGRVRQLFAELAHQLLAHQFAGEEALALVGDLVLGVQRGLLRQQREQVVDQRLQCPCASAPTPDARAANSRPSLTLAMNGSSLVLSLIRSTWLTTSTHRARRLRCSASKASVSSSSQRPASITSNAASTPSSAPRAARFIQRFIARFCSRWMPGVSTSSNCPCVEGGDAEQAMARGLRAVGGDADLGADQRVDQRRLADVGTADDGDLAGAMRDCVHAWIVRAASRKGKRRRWVIGGVLRVPGSAACSRASTASAASCSAARREPPRLRRSAPGRPACNRRGTTWRGRRRSRTAARRPASGFCRACSHSCRRVLASLPSLLRRRQRGDRWLEPGQHRRAAGFESGIEIDRRDQRLQRIGEDRIAAMAAGLHFPGPERRAGAPRSSARAIVPARIRAPVRRARGSARLRRPCGQRAYSASATNRLTSASPRNSSRSLCGAPALRWVRAWASRPGSTKR